MDILELRIPYPPMPEVARINMILAKYAAFGIAPFVIPPPVLDGSRPHRPSVQTTTDRDYIKALAARERIRLLRGTRAAAPAERRPTSARPRGCPCPSRR